MRSLVKANGVAERLVRLAGLLESGKRHAELTAAIEDQVQSRLSYILCCHQRSQNFEPDLRESWRSAAVREIYATQVMLLNIGIDWDDHEIIHYCAPDCPMVCRARNIETRAAYAMHHAQRALRLSVGARLTKPLKYRWKGFE